MGRTAVLDTGKMVIVVSEKRAEPFDLGVFTHCAIDPRRKKYVLIKSRHISAPASAHRQAHRDVRRRRCTDVRPELFQVHEDQAPALSVDLDMPAGPQRCLGV